MESEGGLLKLLICAVFSSIRYQISVQVASSVREGDSRDC